MKKNLDVKELSADGLSIMELDDGSLEKVVGLSSFNFYDCTNRADCSGSTNAISCNSSTCLTES